MLWLVCGFSTTYRKFKMSVQMIELEEVMMVETTDDALEATGTAAAIFQSTNGQYMAGVCF